MALCGILKHVRVGVLCTRLDCAAQPLTGGAGRPGVRACGRAAAAVTVVSVLVH